MIAALAEAGAVLERRRYLSGRAPPPTSSWRAARRPDGRLLRTYNDGRAKLGAYLEDHAFLLEALLTLYEATLRRRAGSREARERWPTRSSTASPTPTAAASSPPPPTTSG